MNKKTRFVAVLLAAGGTAATPNAVAAEDGHHPHHVAAAVGAASHGGKISAAAGLDYAYIFESRFAVGVYFEEVRGDFDIQAIGHYIVDHNFPAAADFDFQLFGF